MREIQPTGNILRNDAYMDAWTLAHDGRRIIGMVGPRVRAGCGTRGGTVKLLSGTKAELEAEVQRLGLVEVHRERVVEAAERIWDRRRAARAVELPTGQGVAR